MRSATLVRRKSAAHILLSIAIAPFLLPGVAGAGTKTKEKLVHSFGPNPDGNLPLSGIVRGPDGTLYGTTEGGGDSNCDYGGGCGTIYKITPKGQEVILHRFSTQEGDFPFREPALDSSGNLYVTTCCGLFYDQWGSVVKLTPSGSYTNLYSFTGGNDGGLPNGVTVDAEGNIYGVAIRGGASNSGVLYEITSQGQFQVLHAFTGGDDGSFPNGTPMVDEKGNVFGTAEYQGASGCGNIYELTSKGEIKVLHSFRGNPDGCYPIAGVARDDHGNLYGTTWEGGMYQDGGGTLYELSASGKYTILHSFGKTGDGREPDAPPTLVKDAKGNIELYGISDGGGVQCGTIYNYSDKGNYKVVHKFYSHGLDACGPMGLLAAGTDGKFYGASNTGGATNQGTVFELRTH